MNTNNFVKFSPLRVTNLVSLNDLPDPMSNTNTNDFVKFFAVKGNTWPDVKHEHNRFWNDFVADFVNMHFAEVVHFDGIDEIIKKLKFKFLTDKVVKLIESKQNALV